MALREGALWKENCTFRVFSPEDATGLC